MHRHPCCFSYESMWVIKALWERWRFSSVWTVHKSSKYDELLRASDWVVPGSAWIYLYCLHLAAVHGEAPSREFTFRFHCIIKQERNEPSKSRKKQEKHLPALHLNSNFPWSSPLSACTTSRAAGGGGGSFKNRKRIGEIGCCESRMTKRKHWWIEVSNSVTD